MYGLLANAGRREDNAALGGQVAHISAAEADLLRRMGGAGSVNPLTGLPEYYVSAGHGGGQSPGVAATGQAPAGIGAAAGGQFGFTASLGPSSPGTTGTGSAVGPTPPMGFMVGDGGNVSSIASADGGPSSSTTGTNQGLSFSPLANSTYGRVANIANSNIAADSGLVGKGLFGQLGHVLGKATTTGILGFLGDSGALGPAVQAMVRGSTTSTYGGEGSSAAGTSFGSGYAPVPSLGTPQAIAAVAPTSLTTPLPYAPLPTSLI